MVLAAVPSNPLIVVAGIIACPTLVDAFSIALDMCFFFLIFFVDKVLKSQKKEIIDRNFSLTFRVFFLFANLPVRLGLFLRRREKNVNRNDARLGKRYKNTHQKVTTLHQRCPQLFFFREVSVCFLCLLFMDRESTPIVSFSHNGRN